MNPEEGRRHRRATAFLLGAALLCLCTDPARALAAPGSFHWQARWIAADPGKAASPKVLTENSNSRPSPLPLFRYEFQLTRPVSRATLRIAGLGQFEAHLNGRQVTSAVLTPGWTNYRKRILYETYPVTTLLKLGPNAIGVMLGNGMYNVQQTKGRYTKFSGSFGRPMLILQLDLTFADGTRQTLGSSQLWKTAPGPITFSSIYGGEDYDARLEQQGWDQPGFRASGWSSATPVEGPGGQLTPETIPPVKGLQQFDTVTVTHPAPEISVYDLGQNFAGWPEIDASGTRGTRVTMIPGELLDAQGFVSQRSAAASPDARTSFTYILKGTGHEHWHPRFTYYGFRYVQVEQAAAHPAVIHHLHGRFLHDAVSVEGSFTTSDELFTRIHKLIDRAMLSNTFSVLTDCPHREKLGWLEQTYLAGPSLMYNYRLQTLYAKLADDVEDAQLPNGMVPSIAPEFPVFAGSFRNSPEWGLAGILSTWTAYQFYGDSAQLRQHYSSMARYMAYLQSRANNHLLTYGLGDWYDIGPGEPGESKLTTKGLTATATYYQALTAMSRIALLAEHPDEAAAYEKQSILVKAAFNAQFFHPVTSQYDRGSQTANAMPLAVGLVPDENRSAVLANLVADIRSHTNHVTAGDIGFHYVVRALTDNGRSDVLYDMLSRTDKPSYGDQLARGATALTEAWDANPHSSQNHFMLGHAEEWFYRGLAGIDFNLARSAQTRILIHPSIVGNIQNATATFHSKLGVIESGWQRSGPTLRMSVTIPDNTTATIRFPHGYSSSITVNGHPLRPGGVIRSVDLSSEINTSTVVAGGRYVFQLSRL